MSNTTVTGAAHPAPHRHRISIRPLLLGLFGVPFLWGIRLVANYALASHFCFPDATRRHTLPGTLGWIWPTMVAIDLLTILAGIATVLISYRNWRITADERASPNSVLIEIGEGRTRFLSLWALLVASLFILAAVFDLIALYVVPVCA
jgi:hypothetical protein